MLDVQVRIAATQRGYDAAEQEQLGDLFGEPHRWGDTLRGLLWTHATLVVPPFDGATVVDLDVPCTYDFDVAAAKYLAGAARRRDPARAAVQRHRLLRGRRRGALQVSRISWSAEAAYRLPVARLARDDGPLLPAAAPGCALDRDAFDRLAAFRARHALPSWEAVARRPARAARGRA